MQLDAHDLVDLRAELVAARRSSATGNALSAAALLVAACALFVSASTGSAQSLIREAPPQKHLKPEQHYVDLQELAIYQVRA